LLILANRERVEGGGNVDSLKLAPADIEIIRSLQDNPRASVARIASRLAMPESTVRHRLNRLVRRGLIEFTVMTNPLQLGYQIWAIVEIQAEMPKIRAVARSLAAAPEVYFVGITTGGYDVLAAAVFRSNQGLLDFITRRLSRVPGIVRTTTSSVLEVVKRTPTFVVPAAATINGRPSRSRRRRRAG
jgi:Lrp/AsnC family transcriptional regulator for asnA, asnC and gidA